jgi:hypothetical protein
MGLWTFSKLDVEPSLTGLTPDLAEVVEAQTTAKVRDEVKDLRQEIDALESALTEAIAQADKAREEEEAREAEPAPTPVRVRRAAPAPVVRAPPPPPEPVEPVEPVLEEPEPEPPVEPELWVAEVAEPEPPPPSPPHPAAASLDGLWLGSVGGRDLALDLLVSPDGSVGGSARVKRAGEVSSAVVRGQVSKVDGAFQVELQVTQDGETTSYSGRLEDGGIQGRVAQGGRTRGRWRVGR